MASKILRKLGLSKPKVAPEPHFVKDYNKLVSDLKASHSLDEAMSIAVGGDYEFTGAGLADVLKKIGFRAGMSLVDLGCGSGRLSTRLGQIMPDIQYLGLDVVPDLLAYAKSRAPEHFRFELNTKIALPMDDDSADFFCAFSVFTHLLHQESFVYLQEAKRVLKPGGVIVFSTLEAGKNWPIFLEMVEDVRHGGYGPHLNQIIERSQIQAWADYLELEVMGMDFGLPHDGRGQTVVALRVPEKSR